MALHRSTVVYVTVVMMLCSLMSSTQGRKLLMKGGKSKGLPSAGAGEDTLYLAALPKGKVALSTPSRRGNAAIFDEDFIARHLAAMDRILRSVPSPGVGH